MRKAWVPQAGDAVSWLNAVPMTVVWANNRHRGLWRVSARAEDGTGVIDLVGSFRFVSRPRVKVAA